MTPNFGEKTEMNTSEKSDGAAQANTCTGGFALPLKLKSNELFV